MKRSSLAVKTGRFYQNISPAFGFIDPFFKAFLPVKNEAFDTPVIILLAPPRSGSTLSYQMMTTGIKGFYLTNLWNVLATTPHLGGMISKYFSKDHASNLSNEQGMVNGLSGEAEGMFFFTQNIGQGLIEKEEDDLKKYHSFAKMIQRLGGPQDGAFIAGYMGHVFSIEALRKVFRRIVFVHLSRDLVSNAMSLERIAPIDWVSSRPRSLSDTDAMPRKEQISRQLVEIHLAILKNKGEDFVSLNYREICENPKNAIGKVLSKAQQLYGVDLKNKNLNLLPEKLKYSAVEKFKNEESTYYHNSFLKEIESLGANEQSFFQGLIQ